MAGSTYTGVLDAARKLPPEDQRRLAAELLREAGNGGGTDALAAVEETQGSMKLPDADTLRWLAEDEELFLLPVVR